MSVARGRPRIALAANDSWNIVNYRAGLIRSLQQAGYDVHVLAPDGGHADAVRALGVQFHPVAMKARGKSPTGDLAVLLAFWRRLRAIRPDAFLGFTAKPNIYGSMAAGWCGIPVVNNISGLGAAFVRPGILQQIVGRLYRLALRRSAVVFFQNRDDQEMFVARGIVSRDQSALLPGSGVDLAHFTPVERRAGEGPAFLLAGRLLWDKGVGEYVDAARAVRARHPGVRFRILGIVERKSAAAVPLSKLREWEAEGATAYLGSSDDVRQAFAEADCVVLPSYYREGVPRVLLEASAMAIPIITTDMPGCREAVDDGVTGFLCAPRSVDSLVSAIERFIAMPAEQRLAMGAAARTKMEREFREDIVHRAYIEALGKLGPAAS
jgi:glycosyltransferase involved in cell wall biosynthesis